MKGIVTRWITQNRLRQWNLKDFNKDNTEIETAPVLSSSCSPKPGKNKLSGLAGELK